MSIIVIDPGHGGEAKVGGSSPNNARGPSGLLEKAATLAIARRLVPVLEAQGHTVILTRDGDVNVGLSARAHVARDRQADAFVSIHFNGFNGRTQGTETFVHARSGAPSTALAKLVQQFMLAVTQHTRSRRQASGVRRVESGAAPRRHGGVPSGSELHGRAAGRRAPRPGGVSARRRRRARAGPADVRRSPSPSTSRPLPAKRPKTATRNSCAEARGVCVPAR